MNPRDPASGRGGFTLVEILVSTAILTLLMVVLVSMTDATRKTWSYTTTKTEEFREAREAFEGITRRLGQATLNTYLDYHYPNNDRTKAPDKYDRQSELRFISGDAKTLMTANGVAPTNTPTHAIFFQAPLGYVSNSDYSNMDSLLNTWGYFIEYATDPADKRPGFIRTLDAAIPKRYRFRMMEMAEPSETMILYQYTSGVVGSTTTSKNPVYFTHPALFGLSLPTGTATPGTTGLEWFTTSLSYPPKAKVGDPVRPTRVLAENIVALIVLPKLAVNDEQALIAKGTVTAPLGANLSPSYSYDSTAVRSLPDINPKNQLPPTVQVTMVAVDEPSFNRMKPGENMPVFTTGVSTGLFSTTAAGTAANFQNDLNQLQANLSGKSYAGYTSQGAAHLPLNYRVFSTNVSIKSARWSREQKD